MKSFQIVFLLLITFCFSSTAQSPTIFMSDRDNTLYESASGALSNGAGIWLFAGRTGQASNSIRRGLIHFNISTLASNAVVDSVSLALTYNNPRPNGTQLITIHRVTNSWGEGTSNAPGQEGGGATSTTNSATWLHRMHTSSLWSSAGGDFNSSASASISIGTSNGVYTIGPNPGMLSDVQGWHANSTTNHGWLLQGNEASGSTSKRFCTKENTSIPPCLPMLTVYWHTAPLSLVDFNVKKVEKDAYIRWIYNNPSALQEILIEHAGDNRQFKTFERINGSRIKAEGSMYYYNMASGSNYFRLVFVLKDGQKEYSEIKALEVKTRGFKVYPNPFENVLSLGNGGLVQDEVRRVEVLSIEGRTIREFGRVTQLDLGDLDPGLYLLKVELAEGPVVKRIIKQ